MIKLDGNLIDCKGTKVELCTDLMVLMDEFVKQDIITPQMLHDAVDFISLNESDRIKETQKQITLSFMKSLIADFGADKAGDMLNEILKSDT